jgi:hypothetical protein
MFENKYAKLPDEPPMSTPDVDPSSSTSAVRNNGPIPTPARQRNRKPSKNFTNPGTGGVQSSMITSSDEGASTDDSSDDEMQTTDENTLRQLRVLQDQVNVAFVDRPIDFHRFLCLFTVEKLWRDDQSNDPTRKRSAFNTS